MNARERYKAAVRNVWWSLLGLAGSTAVLVSSIWSEIEALYAAALCLCLVWSVWVVVFWVRSEHALGEAMEEERRLRAKFREYLK